MEDSRVNKAIIIPLILLMFVSNCCCGASAKTEASISPSVTPNTIYPDMQTLLEQIEQELTDYWENNRCDMEEFATSFLNESYQSATYDENGALLWDSYNKESIYVLRSDLPSGICKYYELSDPPFATVWKQAPGFLISNVEAVILEAPFQRTNTYLQISGELCYGKGISESLLRKSYSVILSEDWIIYFEYDEDSLYYEQFDFGSSD